MTIPDSAGAPFAVVHPRRTVALGLCAELTEQSGRRLVHSVNYRSDAAIEEVKVCSSAQPPGARA